MYEDERVTFAEHFRIAAGSGPDPDRALRGPPRATGWPSPCATCPSGSWPSGPAIAAGAVVVPLNAWWTGAELAYGLHDSGTSRGLRRRGAPRADPASPRRDPRPQDRVRGQSKSPVRRRRGVGRPGLDRRAARQRPGPVIPFAELMADARPTTPTLPDVAIGPDDDATIFYTSGTTGRPKGAVGTHRNSVLQPDEPVLRLHRGDPPPRAAAVRATGSGNQNANLLSVPLFHATGCHAVLVTNTAAGGKLVMMHHFDPERALELDRAGADHHLRRGAGHGDAGHRLPQTSPTGTPRRSSPSPTAGRRVRPTWSGGSRSTSPAAPRATATA